MHKRGLCRHAMSACVCLSVCPSVTFVNHVKMNKRIFKIFSPSGSRTIQVIRKKTPWHYSDGDPLKGASNARGYEQVAPLSQRPRDASCHRTNILLVTQPHSRSFEMTLIE